MNATDPVSIVCHHLDALDIPWKLHRHPAVYTVDQAREHWERIPGGHAKNLFLRNKRGNRHILAVLKHDTPFDIRAFGERTGAGRLSFASAQRLEKWLGVEPGSVTPFALINDGENHVEVFVDRRLFAYDDVNFHPNVNTATVTIAAADFRRFLEACGNDVAIVQL